MEMRVVRHTDRFDEGCRFYGELLGWPVTRQWDEPERGCIFGYGDVGRIELIEADAVHHVSGVFVAVEVPAGSPGVAALADHLTDHGIELVQPVAEQPWGHRNVAVLDPTGMRLVLFEWI
jgi:predicted enzyme related to lactoylglutathione lyase